MANNLPMPINDEIIVALDRAAENGLIASREASQFKRMSMIANSIGQLRELLTPAVMAPIMALQDTSIGFKTDKKKFGGYPVEVVKDCLIEATLKGVYPVGNEFNIIAGQCYITKEGYAHLLRDIPGLKYKITPGVPHGKEGGAVVSVKVEWTYRGEPNSETLELAIRVNDGMGADAVVGKSLRKARAWLHSTVTGCEMGDGEIGEDEPINVTPQKPEKKKGAEAVTAALNLEAEATA